MIFLFSDIEGSTHQWEVNKSTMQSALAKHDAILQDALNAHGGSMVKHTGDGLFATFESNQALICAFEIQKNLANADWGSLESLKVRIALHAGEAEFRMGDWFGPAVNRAARLMAAAWGGQILVTPAAAQACQLPDGASLKDLGVHLLKDLSEPQQIFSLVHPDINSEFPPINSLSSKPNNLPSQVTPFIGRQAALSSVGTLIGEQNCRLVTVLGPGGMGKTRLALQTAADQIDAFPHGVYFVPLAPIESASVLPGTIATALSYPLSEAGDPVQQLVNYLSNKELLLVMDNFEHVLSGASVVSDLLQGTPGVHVVATSRARLNLQSECVFELEGLDVPDSPETTIFENFEAVEMFMTYARRAQSDFELSEEDKAAVVKICSLLGGIPLGIELAAAWARTLSPHEIAEELADDIDFLATNMRDVPERHRSMRAAFNYSWNLLDAEEQNTLARLSVFRGGFDRHAAKVVAGANIRMLGALVDKSLIHHEADGRFSFHELLRQFAFDMLTGDEQSEVHDAHCRYFAQWMDDLMPSLMSETAIEGLASAMTDIDNLRSAFSWATEQTRVAELALMNLPMEVLCQYTARYQEGWTTMRGAQQALLAVRADPEAEKALAEVEVQVAWFGLRLGHFKEALEAAYDSLEIFERLDLWPIYGGFAHPLSPLCILNVVIGQSQKSLDYCKRIDELLEIHTDVASRTGFYYAQTSVYSSVGDYENARSAGERAVRTARDLHNVWFLAYCLHELGHVEWALGNLDQARDYYREALELREAFGDAEGVASARNFLGRIAAAQGQYDEALRLFNPNIDVYKEIGDMGGLAWTYYGLARVNMEQQDLENARQFLLDALTITQTINFVQLATLVLVRLGELMAISGQEDAGLALVEQVARHPSADADARNRAEKILTRYDKPVAPTDPSAPPIGEIITATLATFNHV